MDASLLINPYYGLRLSAKVSYAVPASIILHVSGQARRQTLALLEPRVWSFEASLADSKLVFEIMHLEAALKFGPAFIYNEGAPVARDACAKLGQMLLP